MSARFDGHTPGPWWTYLNSAGAWGVNTIRDGQGPDSPMVGSDYGASICTNIGDHTEKRTSGNEEVNARLIAAAPDLLALVKKMAEALELAVPSGVCLTNVNVPDSTIVPLDTTMGDLRKIAATLTEATAIMGEVK